VVGDDWYIGSITDQEGRTLQADLSFLDPGVAYVAESYQDAKNADWKDNPLAIDIDRAMVTRDTKLLLTLAPGGGEAIRLRPDRR
jgi:alpha-glucosidase